MMGIPKEKEHIVLISTNYYLTLIKIQPYSLDILVYYLHLAVDYWTEKPTIHYYSLEWKLNSMITWD